MEYPVEHCREPDCRIRVLEPYGVRLLPAWWLEDRGELSCRRCGARWTDRTPSRELGF